MLAHRFVLQIENKETINLEFIYERQQLSSYASWLNSEQSHSRLEFVKIIF